MNQKSLEKREMMMRSAEYMELTLLLDKALDYGHVRVLDFMSSAIIYRATFWYGNWKEILQNNVWRLIQDLRIMHRIITLEDGSEDCHLPLLDRIREFIQGIRRRDGT